MAAEGQSDTESVYSVASTVASSVVHVVPALSGNRSCFLLSRAFILER